MKSMINKSASLEVKDFNDESRTVKGYASVFSNVDSDNDVLLKGAFNRTIKAWDQKVRIESNWFLNIISDSLG